MKTLQNLLLAPVIISLLTIAAHAQTTDTTKDLVKQGVALNDAGKYPEAIEKYTEALKADPNNLQADYEMGYTLYSSGKGKDAIPFLEKIVQSKDSKYETYDLLGSIYDDNNEGDKAIECYKNGIKDNPNYERLHFNLGISYLRQKRYAEAEACETDAIKLDPKHASSQRIYAMAEYEQGKRIYALEAWCSFLLIEPNSERSADVFKDMKKVINYGVTQKDAKHTNINISVSEMSAGTLSLPLTVIASTEGKTGLSAVDSLTLQLTAIFKAAPGSDEIIKQPALANFYAKFFDQLAASGNMPAFVRLISLSVYKDDDVAWFKENSKQLDALDLWIRSAQRTF